MKEDHIIISEPEEIKDDDYIYANCMCPVLLNYSIKIAKRQRTTEHKEYRFKCKKCGLEGVIIA